MWSSANRGCTARVADAAHNFPLDLKPWISADILNNYDGMAGCTFGDKVYCVRNDLAQFVLYYNKPVMDQFGYTVPTTFEELAGPERQAGQGTSRLLAGHLRRRLDVHRLLRRQRLPVPRTGGRQHDQDRHERSALRPRREAGGPHDREQDHVEHRFLRRDLCSRSRTTTRS